MFFFGRNSRNTLYKKRIYENFQLFKEIKQTFKYTYYRKLSKKQLEKKLKKMYEKLTGNILDWENLETYTQKMQWSKIYDATPQKSRLADKYAVRTWVSERIGEEYLIPLIGVWDKVEEIDFSKFPKEFVLKTTNASGTNMIIDEHEKFDLDRTLKLFNRWIKKNQAYSFGFQLLYQNIKPRIIAEEYIVDQHNQLNDYKFICFNGEVYYCWVDVGRHTRHYRNIYNLKWELQPWNQHEYGNSPYDVVKPINFDKMISLARVLCQGFSHVRVDLYNVDGKIYFGEMTFTNASGMEKITPYKYDKLLGELWELPINK